MKFGLIGGGYMAREYMKVLRSQSIDVVAFTTSRINQNSKKFQSDFNIPMHYVSWKKMLQSEILDGLIVAAPTAATHFIIQDLTNLSLPILIEKPGALNSLRFSKYRSWKNQSIYFGYNRRFYDSVIEFKKISDNSEGFFKFDLIQGLQATKDQIRKDLIEVAVHFIDLLNHLIPQNTLTLKISDFTKSNYIFTIRNSEQQICGMFTLNFGGIRNHSITFEARDIYVQLSPIEKIQIVNSLKEIEPTDKVPIRRYVPHYNEYPGGKIIFSDSVFKPGLAQQVKEFIAIINEVKSPLSSLIAKPIDAFTNLKSIEDIINQIK
jgi:predicted dehydrogenase